MAENKFLRHHARRKLLQVSCVAVCPALLRTMQQHLFERYPMEDCGLLVGRFDGEMAVAERVLFVDNISESPERFTLAPIALQAAAQTLESGEEIVGFFHSHSGSPEPSNLDKINMRFLPVVWLIIGGAGKRDPLRCSNLAYKTHRKEIRAVEVRVLNRPQTPALAACNRDERSDQDQNQGHGN